MGDTKPHVRQPRQQADPPHRVGDSDPMAAVNVRYRPAT